MGATPRHSVALRIVVGDGSAMTRRREARHRSKTARPGFPGGRSALDTATVWPGFQPVKTAVCHCCVSSANVCDRPLGHCSQSSGTPATTSLTQPRPGLRRLSVALLELLAAAARAGRVAAHLGLLTTDGLDLRLLSLGFHRRLGVRSGTGESGAGGVAVA